MQVSLWKVASIQKRIENEWYYGKGERKCPNQIALTTWWWPDGVLNSHGDLMASKMAYFGSHLVPRSYLGRHQVTKDFGRHLVLALAFTLSTK